MTTTADPVPLDRLTPATAAEVRRNLFVWIGFVLALVVATLAVVFVAAGTDSQTAGLLGVVLLGTVAAVGVPTLAVFWVMAYPLGFWPGLLRTRFVAATWGVDPAELTNTALKRRVGQPGYWPAVLPGVVAGAVAAAVIIAGVALVRGRFTVAGVFPPCMFIGFGGQLAARAWLVRRAVAEKLAGPPPAVP